MSKEISKQGQSIFEQIRLIDEYGNEYWNSRVFAKVIDYSDFRNFLKVVDRDGEACKQSGYNPNDHIVEFNDMIEVGKGQKVYFTH